MNGFGIMFHHFHDKTKHIRSQGSISGDDFRQLIFFLKSHYEILDADVYFQKAKNSDLKANQICLTFDDALACQFDIAYPILEELDIKAFWFLYSSIYNGALEKLEIYRHFRFSKFDSVESFYIHFLKTAALMQDNICVDVEKEIMLFDPKSYAQEATFYTDMDRTFRYLRDCVLKEEKYYSIMDNMVKTYKYNVEANKALLWIGEEQVRELHKNKHIIGLHSHTHPTVLAAKSFEDQMAEYSNNKSTLERIIQDEVFSIAYPCSSYNDDTDIIMDKLGIQLGFDARMSNNQAGLLHLPRKDHVYVMEEMKNE